MRLAGRVSAPRRAAAARAQTAANSPVRGRRSPGVGGWAVCPGQKIVSRLRAADADTAIGNLVAALSHALDHLELPPPLSDDSQGAKMAEQMRTIVRERIDGFV